MMGTEIWLSHSGRSLQKSAPLIVTDHFAPVAARQSRPCGKRNGLIDESYRAVTEEDVGPSGMQGIHLVGVAQRAIGRMNNLGDLIDGGPAMGPDVAASVIMIDSRSTRS